MDHTDDPVDDATLLMWARRLTRHMIRKSPGLLAYHTYDDLLSDAMLGAVKAEQGFQPGHGTTRASYAWQRMRGEVLDGMRRRSPWTREELAAGETGPRVFSTESLATRGWDPQDLADQYQPVENTLTVQSLLRQLPRRQREIVTRTYLDGQTLTHVADEWGVTVGRASQVRAEALITLRHLVNAA